MLATNLLVKLLISPPKRAISFTKLEEIDQHLINFDYFYGEEALCGHKSKKGANQEAKGQKRPSHFEVIWVSFLDKSVIVFSMFFLDALREGLFFDFGAQRSPKQVPLGRILVTCRWWVEHVKIVISLKRSINFKGWTGSEI